MTTQHAPDTMTVGSLNRINKSRSRWSRFMRKFAAHKLALTGGIILLIVVLVAIIGPLVTGSPTATDS